MRFEKVSFQEFKHSLYVCGLFDEFASDEQIRKIYDSIELPKRSTTNSAGYDFKIPYSINVRHNRTVLVPTGIKAKLDHDKVLLMMPRSSLGFKYGMRLSNTIGVIDADYYNNNTNEGHIMINFTTDCEFCINEGEKFVQGIIVGYYRVLNDNQTTVRTGGIGSTNKEN